MGTRTANDLIARAAQILFDDDGVRWDFEDFHLAWLNTGITEVLSVKPEEYTVTSSIVLAAGTKQAVPANCNLFFGLTRCTGGPAIRRIEKDVLDASHPDWHTDEPTTTPRFFCFDKNTPKVYFVWPGAAANTSADAIYGGFPSKIQGIEETIPLDDSWEPVLIWYLLHCAYSMNIQGAGYQAKADAYFDKFEKGIALRDAAEKTVTGSNDGKAER